MKRGLAVALLHLLCVYAMHAWRRSGPRRRVARRADANGGSEMLSALIICYDQQCRYGPAGVAYHGSNLVHRRFPGWLLGALLCCARPHLPFLSVRAHCGHLSSTASTPISPHPPSLSTRVTFLSLVSSVFSCGTGERDSQVMAGDDRGGERGGGGGVITWFLLS